MSKEYKFTPGEWKFHENGDANSYSILTNEKRWVIGFLQNGEIWTDEQRANAKLICAAPDMLQALIQAKESLHVYIKRAYDEAGASEEMAEQLATQELEKMLLFKAINKAII